MFVTTRSKDTYFERIASRNKEVQQGIRAMINNFESFCLEKYGKAEIVKDMAEMKNEQVMDILQSWIDWNDTLSAGTVKFYFSKLKSYLYYFGIKLHPQDIKEELKFRQQLEEELYPITREDIQTIAKSLRYKHKVLFICQSSSMMRIGEMVQIRKKHLIADRKNIVVKIPANLTKLKRGRTTFFSKEASRLLRPILRDKKEDDLVFGSSEVAKHAKITAQGVLRNALDRTGLNMKYETTNRNMINTHCFRAFGITKLSRHDPNLAKLLAGQKGYLLQYDRLTVDEKLSLYEKYESDLIIDDTEKLMAKNKKLEEEKSEIENLKKEMQKMNDEKRKTEDMLVSREQLIKEITEQVKQELQK